MHTPLRSQSHASSQGCKWAAAHCAFKPVSSCRRPRRDPQCQAVQRQLGDATDRRQVLSGLLGSTLLLGTPNAAHAGLDRYVKKKKLDPLDTYVPLVLEARDTLVDLDSVMVEDPSVARQLLRSGPFRGMRDNIRAIGQYAGLPASEGGSGLSENEASQLVQNFFRALEDFDLVLYNAVREAKQQEQKAAKQSKQGDEAVVAVDPAVGLDKDAAAQKLQLAVQQLDQLIATVPAAVMDKSQQVLAKVTGKQAALRGGSSSDSAGVEGSVAAEQQ